MIMDYKTIQENLYIRFQDEVNGLGKKFTNILANRGLFSLTAYEHSWAI